MARWSRPPLGALVDLAEPGRRADAGAIGVTAGDLDGFLVVALPAPRIDAARSTSSSRSPSTSTRPGSTGCARRRTPSPARCSPTSRCARRSARGTRCGSPRRSRGSAAAPPTRARSRSTRTPCSRCSTAGRGPPRGPARGPRPGPARRPADPPAAQRHGEVGRLPHRLRAPRARLRRQRPRARAGRRGGAARRRAARREAVGRPAPRVPQPAPGGRHPPADRDGRDAVRARSCRRRWDSPAHEAPEPRLIAGKAADRRDARAARGSCARSGPTGCFHAAARAGPLGRDAGRRLQGRRLALSPTTSR